MRKQFIWIQNIIKHESHNIRKKTHHNFKSFINSLQHYDCFPRPSCLWLDHNDVHHEEYVIHVVRIIGDLCYFFCILQSQNQTMWLSMTGSFFSPTKPGLMIGAYSALADGSKYDVAASNRSYEFGRLNIEIPRIGDGLLWQRIRGLKSSFPRG